MKRQANRANHDHQIHLVAGGKEYPMMMHNNSSGVDEVQYGAGMSYFVPTFRGKGEIDTVEMLKYIKTLPEAGISDDPSDIKYQDKPFPHGADGAPLYEPVKDLANDVMTKVATWTDSDVRAVGSIWSISHGFMEQTYAHDHAGGNNSTAGITNWACVYWVQVPEGSGVLELYPKGLYYNSITIEITPVAGDYFVFPGDLLHGVRHNINKTEERVSVSFNMETLASDHWLDEP